jgi:hypothetical protein
VRSRGLGAGSLVVAILLILGVAAAGGGGFGLYTQLTRHATAAESRAAGQREVATRWLRMSAGQIFPRTVSYLSTGSGGHWSARLVGIAPQASCAAATDPAAGAALVRSGCETVLRATYADASGTLIATVGIAVMPSAARAGGAFSAIQEGVDQGVLAAPFPGTVADRFGNAQRAVFGQQDRGPYILFDAVGFADGRVTHMADSDSALRDLGDGIVRAVAGLFAAPGNPCREKDIRC